METIDSQTDSRKLHKMSDNPKKQKTPISQHNEEQKNKKRKKECKAVTLISPNINNMQLYIS